MTTAAMAYTGYLKAQHLDFKMGAMRKLGRPIKQSYRYVNSFNGITLTMTTTAVVGSGFEPL